MVSKISKSCAVALLCAAGTFAIAGAEAASDPAKREAVARYTQAIIDSMDADKNGDVSKAEYMDFLSVQFDRLDVDHDGKLVQKELVNKEIIELGRTGVAPFTKAIIDRMDVDKNSEVSKTEFMDFMSMQFDRLDVNHDGKLVQKEILRKLIIGPRRAASHR